MGKTKSKYPAQIFETPKSHEAYARFHYSLLTSDAYKSLSHAARTVYTLMKLQYKGDYTGNRVTCPYSFFKSYGMNSKTVKRAIQELEQKGFIKVSGGTLVSGNLRRTPNEYRFSSEWQKWKQPP